MAAMLNMQVFRNDDSTAVKYFKIISITSTAFAVYFLLAIVCNSIKKYCSECYFKYRHRRQSLLICAKMGAYRGFGDIWSHKLLIQILSFFL